MPSSSRPDTQQTSGISNAAAQTELLTKYIDIQTDTLELSIDLIGGDIVSLSLPKYLKQIDVADDPFKLLENSLGRSYIALSGLIGQNGIDNSGRAMYESRHESYRLEGGKIYFKSIWSTMSNLTSPLQKDLLSEGVRTLSISNS